MRLFKRQKERKTTVENDEIFSVAYVAYCTPGMFGGESTWISDSEKRGFLEKTRATPSQIARARMELINWMIAKASVPSESVEITRNLLGTELLEEEFVVWLSDVTCNSNFQPPLFDTEGLKTKMESVQEIPVRWDSFDRHAWRLQEARAHSGRLHNSMLRVTKGAQRSALGDLASISDDLEKQTGSASNSSRDEKDLAGYCGLPACSHCASP